MLQGWQHGEDWQLHPYSISSSQTFPAQYLPQALPFLSDRYFLYLPFLIPCACRRMAVMGQLFCNTPSHPCSRVPSHP